MICVSLQTKADILLFSFSLLPEWYRSYIRWVLTGAQALSSLSHRCRDLCGGAWRNCQDI